MSAPQAVDAGNRPVFDGVVLSVGALLTVVAAVVLVAQYRPVLFRHDTAFIGLSLAVLVGFAVVVGLRVGRRAAQREEPRLLRTSLWFGAVVVGFAATASLVGVLWYRVQDGVGWPRVELGALVLLVGGLASVGAMVGGWTHRWWALAWLVGAGLCLGAVVAAVVASWMMENDFSDRRADRCIARGIVTYCHYPGFEPFVDDWAGVIDAVVAGAPSEAVPGRLKVQQAANQPESHLAAIRPAGAGVVPLLEWSPGDTAPFVLAVDAANWLTGRVSVPEVDSTFQVAVDGGGRGVVTFWLAAKATERTRRGFEFFFYECGEAVNGNPYGEAIFPETAGSGGTDRYAEALLNDPDARRKVGAHWAELTRPETTVVEAARLLGIEPEPEQPNRC